MLQCQKLGTEILKGRPCPFCNKNVTDRRKHPEQCGVLFQILLGDSVLQITRTTTGPLQSFFKVANPTVRPAAKPKPPISVGTEPPPLDRTAAGAFPHPHSSSSSSSSSLSSPLKLSFRASVATQEESRGDASHDLSFSLSHPQVASLAFKNTSNYCYVNAAMQAMLATTTMDSSLRSLQPLLSLISNTAQSCTAPPLNLINPFPLRSLLPRWRFDGTQQDSAEFLQSFLAAASELPLTRRWATVDLITGRLAVEGGPLIMLMQHSASSHCIP